MTTSLVGGTTMRIAALRMGTSVVLSFALGAHFLSSDSRAFEGPFTFSQGDPLVATEREFSRPESYVERVRREGAFLELTLNDAIKLALSNNLEITIENYNEEIHRQRMVGTKGFYDPVLNFTVGWNSLTIPTTSVLDAGRGIAERSSDNFAWNSALEQNFPGGGSFNVGFDNQRFSSNSTFSFINPRFGSDFAISLRQPLWRGFKRTETDRQLKLVNLDSQINDSQFEQRVSEIVQEAQNQYWELVFSIANHETRRHSVELAIIQHQNNQKRVRIGVAAPIEITSSHAEVASREQEMIQSEVDIIRAQNGLKRLLAPDPKASIWNLVLISIDCPQSQEVRITLEEAIETAISRRQELEQVRLEIERNEVDRSFYQKEGKPRIDLRADFGSRGASGRVFSGVGGFFGGTGVPEVDENNPSFGNLTKAWGQTFGFDFTNWGIFADVRIPLRDRSNAAQLAQVAIRERQLLSRLKDQQQMVIVDVRNAFESIVTQKKRSEAARLAGRLSEEQLEGENKRFQAGLSTNFEVLRFQRDLVQAVSQELRAEIDYQLALVSLQKAMYVITDANDIRIARRDGRRH